MLYLKDTQKWKQFTTSEQEQLKSDQLCYISKILKNESNSQRSWWRKRRGRSCVISQRYSKMKAIHNTWGRPPTSYSVVLYLKDTQKWKQFTTTSKVGRTLTELCYISKILKNESNSQLFKYKLKQVASCVISQRYSKMKAIHNRMQPMLSPIMVVLYLKDTQKWKQFTTYIHQSYYSSPLCYISKILKNESNSQLQCCSGIDCQVVLYLKDTQKWKQFTTGNIRQWQCRWLCYISKILKNESNSQQFCSWWTKSICCVISQRYSKMKAIHNCWFFHFEMIIVVLYLKDTQKWKQFTTTIESFSSNGLLCYISKILKNESNSQLYR